MNSKDLLRAFGDIDEKYLDEEHETLIRCKVPQWQN